MQTVNDRNIFLSTVQATRGDRRVALAVVGVSFVLFAIAVPYNWRIMPPRHDAANIWVRNKTNAAQKQGLGPEWYC